MKVKLNVSVPAGIAATIRAHGGKRGQGAFIARAVDTTVRYLRADIDRALDYIAIPRNIVGGPGALADAMAAELMRQIAEGDVWGVHLRTEARAGNPAVADMVAAQAGAVVLAHLAHLAHLAEMTERAEEAEEYDDGCEGVTP